MLLKVLLPILLSIHLLAADISSSRHRNEPHIIVIITVSDTEMVMECILSDHQVGNATWTKDGHEILSELERVSIRNGYMRIDPVLPKDEGTYRCNDGRELELTIPPSNSYTTEVSVMRNLGSTFTIPCGVLLGPVSQTKEYDVMWKLILGTSFKIIAECHHTDLSMLDSPKRPVVNCSSKRYSIDPVNFSLTVFNFNISGLAINSSVPQVKYQCTVEQALPPMFNKNKKIDSAETIVYFRFVPQMPNITIEGCDGDKPIVRVTRPPNFNDLVGLNYTFTIDDTTNGNGTTSGKIVANKNDSSFTDTVEGCGDGCEICVSAKSYEGEGEKACVNVTKDQCTTTVCNGIDCSLLTSLLPSSTPTEDCSGINCSPDIETTSPSDLTGQIVAAIFIPLVVTIVMIVVITVLVIILRQRKRKKATKSSKFMEVSEVDCSKNTSGESGMPTATSVQEQVQQDLSKKNMLFSKYFIELTKVIGQGESGVVYRGYFNSREGKELVAIKTCKPLSSSAAKEKLLREVTTMSLLIHPNVMPLIGMCFDEEMPLLIMPFMSNGNVLEYVKQNEVDLHKDQEASEVEVVIARKLCLGMCHQISKGMEYLAKQKYVHRDLAARNCMIDSEGVIKVTDFGLTEDMYAFCRGENVVGSEERVPIKWMAPESIERSIYNEKTDVWSFGVTCWEVFTCGRVPYSGIPTMTLLKELLSGHRLDRPSNVVCSDEIWEVMTLCWCAQSFQRPKFTHLVKTFSDLLETNSSYLKLSG